MPSLSEAIEKKYGNDDAEIDLLLPIAIYVPKKSPRKCIPSLLVLNDCDIDTAGDEQELGEKCQRVEELDLAQNKLSRWSEVIGILKHMPRVKFVNLSFNSLQEDIPILDNGHCFSCLRNLVLNSTRIDWQSIRALLKVLPSLEELHLSLNGYNYVELEELNDPGPVQHKGVKKLHFTGNPVDAWTEVSKLGEAFPFLESLVVAECPLRSLLKDSASPGASPESDSESCPSLESPHKNFRYLRFLNLNSTLLGTWEDVDRLSRFPALHCLRMQGCPLFGEYTEHERRQFLIARLPNVQTLNGGGIITEEEREDAERAFIRYYMDKPESDRPERYSDLVAIHGRLEPLVQIDLRPERVVKVHFSCNEKRETRNINVYQSVFELRQKLESFAGVPACKIKLFYVDQEMKAIMGPEEMKFPNKQLYSYNISSGDEIIVDVKQK